MPLLSRFDEDLKSALKASDRVKVSVLRMVKAALKNKEIERGHPLTDEEIFPVLSSMIKQRRESIEHFNRAGRLDLVQNEEQEVSHLQAYLPQQLSSEEVDRIIRDAIAEVSAQGVPDIGKIMRILMPRIKGVADGKQVNQRVKEILESPH